MHKTKILVDPVEWGRITTAIQATFDAAGLSRLYAARAVDACAAILYDCRFSTARGRKGFNRACVQLESAWFQSRFKSRGVASKAKAALIASGVLLEDQSWSAPNLHHPRGTWTQSYAIDYSPRSARRVEVWFPSAASILEGALAGLKGVSNRLDFTGERDELRELLRVDKRRLTADARAGKVDPVQLAQFVSVLRKYPSLASCEGIGEDGDERLYSPLTMIAKPLLPYLVNEYGVALREVLDLHASFLFSLHFAFALEGSAPLADGNFASLVRRFYQGRNIRVRGKWIADPSKDLYSLIANGIETADRGTNLFAACRSAADKRKLVKGEVLAAVFATDSQLKKWKTLKAAAIKEAKTKTKVSRGKLFFERQARMRLAICDFFAAEFPAFFRALREYAVSPRKETYRRGGKTFDRETFHKTPLFHALTRGEKILMQYAVAQLQTRFGFGGKTFYRKHDALLACVPPVADSDIVADRLAESILAGITEGRAPYRSEGCKAVAAFVAKREADAKAREDFNAYCEEKDAEDYADMHPDETA